MQSVGNQQEERSTALTTLGINRMSVDRDDFTIIKFKIDLT